ncbi:hypothetical protein GCM10025777_25120 [Membranihabitans marinus]
MNIGTNVSGLTDYGTELPFVNLMKNAREWYSKDVGNPNAGFDSGHADELTYREDGYPSHSPQTIDSSPYPQIPVTIWAITDGWPKGQYTVLWEGKGTLSFWGSYENLVQTHDNRMVFDVIQPLNGTIELSITSSDINDPIRNIRILMPGTENTYQEQPFNPIWLEKLLQFKTIRFMDWGQTNNWGINNDEDWINPNLVDWSQRSSVDHYTWAYEKGVPYEMMIRLMNDYDLDGWVCVPHTASDNYMTGMANLFRDELEPERHLTVEYSNEIWNWIFRQTQWLNEYGCIQPNVSWPEGLVPYVQNCLDHFTQSFEGQLNRITRAVGGFTGWPDVSKRIINNLSPNSYDALALTFYFGINENGDNVLDELGPNATTNDVAYHARQGMDESMAYLIEHKNNIADPLDIPIIFYEGGQHLTPTPFGSEPTYAQALLDIQRDTAMYNMYDHWLKRLRQLQSGDRPLLTMHFGFVSSRNARYGSWGMLETMDQDTSVIPAPKYSAIINNLSPSSCTAVTSIDNNSDRKNPDIKIYPNPTSGEIIVVPPGNMKTIKLSVFNSFGKQVLIKDLSTYRGHQIALSLQDLADGIYFIQLNPSSPQSISKKMVKISN